ncbi:hypothetical protein [Dongshaea marina]|uniref:hypothetical protein n=1 Tax=Dongshaea marina TaxID=2047966 RepID=UPI001902709D|nr:hypothetical protein [Dongshaea marina]
MYRRKLKYSRVKNLFKFASIKCKASLTVESSLEFDTCFHLEYSPSIAYFEAQPEGFYYNFEGKACGYTPDFKLINHDQQVSYLEVKPSRKTAQQDFRNRFKKRESKPSP